MKLHLAAGFGNPLGAEGLATIGALEFRGIRQDIKDPSKIAVLVKEFDESQLVPNFVIQWHEYPAEMAQDVVREAMTAGLPYYAVELGNELNIGDPECGRGGVVDANVYWKAFNDIFAACRRIDPYVKILTAGISNTSRDAIKWLAAVAPHIPEDAICAFHSYRQDVPCAPEDPQKGFSSRAAEFTALRQAAGPRRLWNTEVGWHMAERKTGWFLWQKKFRLTEQQVLDYLLREARINSDQGVEVMTTYQINCGSTDTPIDQYGIRAFDGRWKAQAMFARRFKGR